MSLPELTTVFYESLGKRGEDHMQALASLVMLDCDLGTDFSVYPSHPLYSRKLCGQTGIS